jgi:PII-like signaling protein
MKITVARIYVTEGKHIHEKIFERLHDEHKVKGVTVFRGVTGFGQSGSEHSSSLLDMSFDLPVIVEFFDSEENVRVALGSLSDLVPPGHTITFEAELPDV